MKTLDRQQLLDMLLGCTILGTGGGGDLEAGVRYIDAALDAGKVCKLANLDELTDEQLIFTPYALGATVASEDETGEYDRLPQSKNAPILNAVDRLESHIAKPLDGTLACELGGENTAIAFYVAAMKSGYVLDADIAGRAVPEITHSTFYLNKLDPAPLVLSNQFGETLLCEQVHDDIRAEQIARAFAMVSCNDIAAVDHPLELRHLRGKVIEGTLSKALDLGQALRIAGVNQLDAAKAVAELAGGRVLFRGQVSSAHSNIEDGFTIGEVLISGSAVGELEADCKANTGDTYLIRFKNENMVGLLNNKIQVTIPDLICVLDVDRHLPVTNPDYSIGANVAVIAFPAPAEFLTAEGLEVFGPKYFGLDVDYKPVC